MTLSLRRAALLFLSALLSDWLLVESEEIGQARDNAVDDLLLSEA